MKHLILRGQQGSGKTLLGNWINQVTNPNIPVLIIDECTREDIKRHNRTLGVIYVYITNDKVTYADVDADKFLIIKLTHY